MRASCSDGRLQQLGLSQSRAKVTPPHPSVIHVLTHDSRAQECPSNRWHLLDSHGRLTAGDYTRSSGGVVARPLSNDIVLTATQLQPSWSVTISDRLYLQMTSFDDSLTRANSSFVYFPQFCLLIFFDIFQ